VTALHIRAAALLAAAAAGVALSATLSSCSTAAKTADDHGTHASSAAESSAHNEDDVLFAQLMIPHHQQAVELANMVPGRSANPDVVSLAARVAAEQQPEIDAMKSSLRRWGVNPAEMQHESGHAGLSMQGMVDDSTMLNLRGLKGPDFDILWLTSMIGHHQGAIDMAMVEVEAGKNPEMKAAAGSIITAQQAEIDQMKKMLQTSGG
jgi:uncharacterized protein (DUF305 family)